MAAAAIVVLVLSRPSLESLVTGLVISCCGEAIRLWALGYTGEHTRSQSLAAPALVTSGPYGLVRNPLYLGNFLNSLGVATAACGKLPLLQVAFVVFLMVVSTAVVYGACISVEEEFLSERFGEEYQRYRASVPALLPSPWHVFRFVFGLDKNVEGESTGLRAQGAFSLVLLRFERATLMWLVIVWIYLAVRLIA